MLVPFPPIVTPSVLPAAPVRQVFVHYHIMKNAGSTLAAVLDREFGAAAYEVHRTGDAGPIESEDLAAFLTATPAARAVTSRHLQYPVPEIAGMEIFDCCPIRRPLDRLISLYTFVAGDPGQALHPLAAERDVAAFLELLLNDHPDHVLNVQTVVLASRSRFVAAGPAERDRAVEAVCRSRVPVLVDRFDESMVVAEYFLGPAFPGLRLHDVAVNVTRAGDAPVAAREEALRASCGEKLMRQLRAANALDEELCDALSAELDRRIALIPAFRARLAEFRERCEAARLEEERLEAARLEAEAALAEPVAR
ncbi:MAG TPA: hypothetical protein VK665_01060 [Candidatus Elarobacter sp.]|nr:hypothetical protein [Candidatus Elarobacter sp.]